ncbi:MAG: glycoside hydrolase family 2 TIM barrel-domain containing protein [Verrucomicrobiae bacterium]|nr:glycoside hydrolase family 2 TIM barrel-domain containing protein [Verrucomicrobiae bacterium]
MIINGSEIITRQLSIHEPVEMTFSNGQKTPLTPSRFIPQPAGEDNTLSLDGEWKVMKWPFQKAESKLASPSLPDTRWAPVRQPGKVLYADPDVDGRSVPNWNRVGLDHIDPNDGAAIRRMVVIPKQWKNKRIYLRFDAIYPAGRIYLDGQLLAEHTSGLTPFEFDVTGRVTPGRQVLVAVRLLAKHRFAKMDMVRHAVEFTGLAQSACFFATEACQVSDYHLTTSLDSACRNGVVAGMVTLCNFHPRNVKTALSITLTDSSGKRVASFQKKTTLFAGQTTDAAVSMRLAKPRLWNDEFPNLYTVTLHLSATGQPEQTLTYRTGFRRLDLSPEGAKLNGNPVKFRGVNHLTYHPDHGMHTPPDWLRRNLLLMKKANVNAIRTHFLGPRYLADLCDELGIYLLQELPVDWGTNYIHDPEWVGPALMRLEGGIRRDRHHASVMVWSIGNENMPQDARVAADGWNHLRIYEKFAKILDPSRPTMFPPPGPANKIEGIFELRVGDIADTHYSFNLARKFRKTGKLLNPNSWEANMEPMTREQALARGWSGVWFSSEYGICNMIPDLMNAPYISVIADKQEDILSYKPSMQVFIDRMRDEWGDMRRDPACLGGAYFPWICSGAGKGPEGNPWGWVRWAEDADWGVMCADLTPKPFFWALRTLFSPVWFPEQIPWKKGQTELRFKITNHYNAIDLKDCTLRTLMGGGGPWMGHLARFKDIPIKCPPGETREIRIPIWNGETRKTLNNGQAAICRCVLLDPKGFRPITADMIITPKNVRFTKGAMPLGPDAVM